MSNLESLSKRLDSIPGMAAEGNSKYAMQIAVLQVLTKSCKLCADPSQRTAATSLLNRISAYHPLFANFPKYEFPTIDLVFEPPFAIFPTVESDAFGLLEGKVFAMDTVHECFVDFYLRILGYILEEMPQPPAGFKFPWSILRRRVAAADMDTVVTLLPFLLITRDQEHAFSESDALDYILTSLEAHAAESNVKDKLFVQGLLRLMHTEMSLSMRRRLSEWVIQRLSAIVGAETVRYLFPHMIRLLLSLYLGLLYHPESLALADSSVVLQSFVRKCFQRRNPLLIHEDEEEDERGDVDSRSSSDEEDAARRSTAKTKKARRDERKGRQEIIVRAVQWCESTARAFAHNSLSNEALRELTAILNPVISGEIAYITVAELVPYLFPLVEAPRALLSRLGELRFNGDDTNLLHLLVRSERFHSNWYAALRDCGLDLNAKDYEKKTLLRLCCELRPTRRNWLAWLILDPSVDISTFYDFVRANPINPLDFDDLSPGCLVHLCQRGAFTSIARLNQVIPLLTLVHTSAAKSFFTLIWSTSIQLSKVNTSRRARFLQSCFEHFNELGRVPPGIPSPSQFPFTIELFLFLKKVTITVNMCVGSEIARRQDSRRCPLGLLRQDLIRMIVTALLG